WRRPGRFLPAARAGGARELRGGLGGGGKTPAATKRLAQIGGSRRRRDAAAQDIVGRNWPAIVAVVRAFARADYCALERSANEKAFAPAVSINRRLGCDVGFRSPSHWSSGSTCVRANRHVSTLRKRPNRAFGIKDDDKIGHLRANLQPPTRAAGTDE